MHTTFLIYFTEQIDNALISSNRKFLLSEAAKQIEIKINEIILLLRKILSSAIRLNLRTLLLLLIQAQSILNRLIEKNAASPNDFDWIGQMRYYCKESIIEVNMLSSSLFYGFEYIGNKNHMVITALTDRCYRCVFVALNQHFGVTLQVNI